MTMTVSEKMKAKIGNNKALVPPTQKTPIAESPEDEHQPEKSFSKENPATKQEGSAPLHGTPEKENVMETKMNEQVEQEKVMETKMNEQVARGLRLQQSKLVRTGNSLADALTEDPRKDVGEALAQAKVLVYFKLYKIGCVLSVRGGRGLVMRRMKNYPWKWSAPCAVKMSGFALGATIGLETSGFLLLCNSEEDFTRELDGGSNVGWGTGFNACFALGNQGLSGELFTHTEEAKDARTKASHHAQVVGKSQGLYAGLSFEMSGFKVDQKSNREFYGSMAPSMAELQSSFAPEEGFERMYRLLDLIESVGLSRKQQKADMRSLESSECLSADGVGEEIYLKSLDESLDETKTTSPPNSDTGPIDDPSSSNGHSAQEKENQDQQQPRDKQTPDTSSMNAVEGGAKEDLSSTNGRSQEKEKEDQEQ